MVALSRNISSRLTILIKNQVGSIVQSDLDLHCPLRQCRAPIIESVACNTLEQGVADSIPGLANIPSED